MLAVFPALFTRSMRSWFCSVAPQAPGSIPLRSWCGSIGKAHLAVQAAVEGVSGQLAGPDPQAEVGVCRVGVRAGAVVVGGCHARHARAQLQNGRALRHPGQGFMVLSSRKPAWSPFQSTMYRTVLVYAAVEALPEPETGLRADTIAIGTKGLLARQDEQQYSWSLLSIPMVEQPYSSYCPQPNNSITQHCTTQL